MVDFDKKIEDIVSDYYKTIGKFNNVSSLISQKVYEFDVQDDEEKRKEKEGQREELLIDLGRIAEMAFKYIIKIRRMELYPNEPYLDSNINGHTVRGFRDKEKLPAAVVRDLGNTVHATNEDIESIINVQGVGPKAHDFNYLYLIVNKLMPDVHDKLNEFMKLKIKSDNITKIFKEEEIEYPIFTVFPNEADKTQEEYDKEREQIRQILEKKDLTIAYSGDIFSRLRYYSNNPFDKNYNVDEIYNVVSSIISFIKTVHLYNEKLDFDPEIAFSYYKLKNNPNLSKFNIEEMKKIYSHNKINKSSAHIMDCIYYSNKLSLKEVMDIINCDDISEDDYTSIFTQELNLEKITYFKSIGIEDYDDMAFELQKNMFNNYSFEEYKKLREFIGVGKGQKISSLLKNLSMKSISNLKQYPDLLKFFVDEFYLNVNYVSYNYGYDFFNLLLSIEEVRQNSNSWYGLDKDQLRVYHDVSKILLNDELNDEIINMRNYYPDTIMENIKNNINHFKSNSKMLCVMPLMLDCDDNQHILNILIRNGLDINDLHGFDSTIFCFPTSLVDIIEKIFNFNEIPLIINNKVNPLVMNMIFIIRDNLQSEIELSQRRIPFYKADWNENFNPTNNQVINELSYDEIKDNWYVSPEMTIRIKQFEETIRNINEQELKSYIMSTNKNK